MAFDPKHNSRTITDGPTRAAARSYYYSIGYIIPFLPHTHTQTRTRTHTHTHMHTHTHSTTTVPNKEGWRGTEISVTIAGSWAHYRARVLQYFQQLAVITPYAGTYANRLNIYVFDCCYFICTFTAIPCVSQL